MRAVLIVVAVLALVAIGTAEASISNDQLAQLPGRARPVPSTSGTALTFVGIVLSAAVYATLGLALARGGATKTAAIAIGAAVGAAAGLLGGAIRAYLVSGYLADLLAGYGLADLLVITLGVFVALSVLVSVAAGAGITWLGFRDGRRGLTPRPPS